MNYIYSEDGLDVKVINPKTGQTKFLPKHIAKQFIVGSKVFDTRYGENPHQKGALYEFESQFSNKFKVIKGEPSFKYFIPVLFIPVFISKKLMKEILY